MPPSNRPRNASVCNYFNSAIPQPSSPTARRTTAARIGTDKRPVDRKNPKFERETRGDTDAFVSNE
ncbi:hypothetical protein ZHAS_00017794 [Anopheles sinensis]|uniref:Uncharacterized protein n=1 Tax=Anopheles sinensis TaxID=74873 RepID=A0A084WHT4_ANOSI|nr:hypothetical protein ZHAS_00017794 [Anopheles sinensis]